jgi:hypothetical protein
MGLTFAGVSIVTIAEGDIAHLRIGFEGRMNTLFLKIPASPASIRIARVLALARKFGHLDLVWNT